MIALFPAPIVGKYWSGEESESDGVAVNIIGMTGSADRLFAVLVDGDAVVHVAPADHVDFAAVAYGASPETIAESLRLAAR